MVQNVNIYLMSGFWFIKNVAKSGVFEFKNVPNLRKKLKLLCNNVNSYYLIK